MSFIAGYILGLEEHSPGVLEITANGSYTAEGCWNRVNASVPDRYAEGYADGAASVLLGTKSITANGTYSALQEGLNGYSSVTANVPDRYAEGYADGAASVALGHKSITANGVYTAAADSLSGYDVVTVNVPDRYDEGYADGYADGSASGGYTFPPGTAYGDFIDLVSGDTVTDETTGISIVQEIFEAEGTGVIYIHAVGAEDDDSIFREASGSKTYISSKAKVTDPASGTVTIEFKWYYTDYPGTVRTTTRSMDCSFLVGYGGAGHSFSVRQRA